MSTQDDPNNPYGSFGAAMQQALPSSLNDISNWQQHGGWQQQNIGNMHRGVVFPSYPPVSAVTPGRDFRNKTYYSGIMEAVIALCDDHGVRCKLALPDAEEGIEEFVEVLVQLERGDEQIELGFDALCALAADGNVEGLSQFIEVNCGFLPANKPPSRTSDDEQWASILKQSARVQQMVQQQMMSPGLGTAAAGLLPPPPPPLAVSKSDVVRGLQNFLRGNRK